MNQAEGTRSRALKKGEILFNEGSAGKSVYLVVTGKLLVYREKLGKIIELAQVGERQIVGEMALFSDSPRSASVKALADSRVFELDVAHFQKHLNSEPEWLRILLDCLVNHIKTMNDRILDLTNYSSKG